MIQYLQVTIFVSKKIDYFENNRIFALNEIFVSNRIFVGGLKLF